MVTQINLYQAKTQLSELVERAANGEEIVIAKAGKPRARLVGVREPRRARTPGGWQGRVEIDPQFDAADDRIAELFAGTEP